MEDCDSGDPVLNGIVFAAVSLVTLGASIVGVRWLDQQLRRHYAKDCDERCR